MCQYSNTEDLPCLTYHRNIGEGCKWCDDARRDEGTIQYSDISDNRTNRNNLTKKEEKV
jgi:hypothetical protein